MARFLRILIALTMLVLTSFAVPAAAVPDVPIKGTVTGQHGPPDYTKPDCPDWAQWRYSSHGVGKMSHLGTVHYSLTQCTAPVEGPVNRSEGTIEVVAANGDELYLEHTMLSVLVFGEPGPPLGFTFDGTWTAVGGTGRFAHAKGGGTLGGVGDIPDTKETMGLPDGLMKTSFKGRIDYDASDRSIKG
jgi:hypothetical protein